MDRIVIADSNEELDYGKVNSIFERLGIGEDPSFLFSTLTDLAPSGVTVLRREEIVYTNSAFLEMFGLSTSDLEKKIRFANLICERDKEKYLSFLSEVMACRESEACIFEGIHNSGKELHFRLQARCLKQKDEIVMAIITDVTEQRLSEKRLKDVEDVLARSKKDLEEFSYVASHDLQEPLRMVSSYLQLLKRRYGGKLDSDADEFIEFAVDGSQRMSSLIQDLLSYSRVTSKGKEFELIDSEEAIQAALNNLSFKLEETKAEILVGNLPKILADGHQIVRLFQQLIDNSLKFRGDRIPKIEIAAKLRKDQWEFSVKDNGIGIDSQNYKRVFVIFQRLHRKSEYQGSGIGLSLSKRIVERHGGSIWVESEESKRGLLSTSAFPLPVDSI